MLPNEKVTTGAPAGFFQRPSAAENAAALQPHDLEHCGNSTSPKVLKAIESGEKSAHAATEPPLEH